MCFFVRATSAPHHSCRVMHCVQLAVSPARSYKITFALVMLFTISGWYFYIRHPPLPPCFHPPPPQPSAPPSSSPYSWCFRKSQAPLS